MGTKIELEKTVYNSEQFNAVVDRSFKEFLQPVEVLSEEKTVEDFFLEYERLFYKIPIVGETASHSYLIRRSSEVAEKERFEEVQPLLDEIASLRRQLLTYQQQILDLTTKDVNAGTL